MKRIPKYSCFLWSLLSVFASSLAAVEERADLAAVYQIKTEAFRNSQVMDYLIHLSDVYGPRPGGSANYRAAAGWAGQKLKELGLANVNLEKWGPIQQVWSYSRFSVHLIEPVTTPFIGYPASGSPGTKGPVVAEAFFAPVSKEADLAQYQGKLKGKLVLTSLPVALQSGLRPDVQRFSDDELAALKKVTHPGSHWPLAAPFPIPGNPERMEAERRLKSRVGQFLKQEGALGLVVPATKGDYGTAFSVSAGTRDVIAIVLAAEHYNRVARILEKGVPAKLEVDIRAKEEKEPADGLNVVAELPGGRKADELVMIGGHLDSTHLGTGATDNAAGCAVVMEVMRILKTLNLKMDRTVRMVLFDAEEMGLRGSKAYVAQHFGDLETNQLKPAHAKLSGFFNFDRGSGKIRGVYLGGNEMARPIFEAWLAPFEDLGASTVTIIGQRGRSDHLSFDAVGLPGFEFIQDPLDYNTRTHHSNMDVTDRVQPGDLMQAAAVIASFTYHTATRAELLPRKPLPARLKKP